MKEVRDKMGQKTLTLHGCLVCDSEEALNFEGYRQSHNQKFREYICQKCKTLILVQVR